MTDFSFVSVEVGIPFATSEGALTIYDCNDASRYVVNYCTLYINWLACTAKVMVLGSLFI